MAPEFDLPPILENAPDIVYALNPHGEILSVNQAVEPILGYPKAELIGTSAFALIHPEDRQRVLAVFEESVRTGDDRIKTIEFRMLTRSGQVKHFEVNRRLAFEGGQVVRSEGIARDVTERKQLEERLRLYREIITHSQDPMAILDPQGRYMEQNPAFHRLTGYTAQELQGQTPALLIGEERAREITRLLQAQGRFFGEMACHTREGRTVPVEVSVSALREDGQVVCYVGFARDISQRQRQETRRQVLQQMHEAVLKMQGVDDIEEVLIAIGEGLRALDIPYQNCGINVLDFGAEPPVMRSRSTTREGRWLISDTAEAVNTVVQMWRAGRPVYRRDLEAEDPYGERRYLQRRSRIRAVVDVPFSQGTLAVNSTLPSAFSDQDIATFQELAEVLSEAFRRREDLQKLLRAQAQLMQAEKMAALGKLVAGIAHEINTPLGAIHSMQDTLVRAVEKLKEAIRRDFPGCREHPGLQQALQVIGEAHRVIETGTQRVTAIVRGLRNFARLDEAERKEADLHACLEDALLLIHHDLKNRVRVVKNYGDLPEVLCYPGRLNQVFLNLLNNAQQAIRGEGEIAIATCRQGNQVRIAIRDSGAGIPAEHLPRIFDPGFTTKGVGVGTGLGLSICYQIVRDHGGRIEVESQVGKGTTFTVVLPIAS